KELDRDFVAGQSPAPGKKVERFSKIKLLIANGDKSGNSYAGKWEMYRVKVTMPDAGQPVVLKILRTDIQSTDEVVYEETHDPGEIVTKRLKGYGDTVTFSIFFDGALYKKVTMSPENSADANKPDTDTGDKPKADKASDAEQ
ncbi:MAG: hypothetical protein ABUL72_04020, partial [Armatimonadota bacterium]